MKMKIVFLVTFSASRVHPITVYKCSIRTGRDQSHINLIPNSFCLPPALSPCFLSESFINYSSSSFCPLKKKIKSESCESSMLQCHQITTVSLNMVNFPTLAPPFL